MLQVLITQNVEFIKQNQRVVVVLQRSYKVVIRC